MGGIHLDKNPTQTRKDPPPQRFTGGGRSLFQQSSRRESVERRANVRGIIELPPAYE